MLNMIFLNLSLFCHFYCLIKKLDRMCYIYHAISTCIAVMSRFIISEKAKTDNSTGVSSWHEFRTDWDQNVRIQYTISGYDNGYLLTTGLLTRGVFFDETDNEFGFLFWVSSLRVLGTSFLLMHHEFLQCVTCFVMHWCITQHVQGWGWVHYEKHWCITKICDALQRTGTQNPQTGTLNPQQEPAFFAGLLVVSFSHCGELEIQKTKAACNYPSGLSYNNSH